MITVSCVGYFLEFVCRLRIPGLYMKGQGSVKGLIPTIYTLRPLNEE